MLTLIAVGLIAAEAPPATWPIRGSETTSRAALVRRLILKDSAVELVFRPCRTTWRILTDPAYQIYWHTRGTVGKALLPWHAHCQPLHEDRPSLDAAALEADLAAVTKVPLEPAHIQLFPEGPAALAVLEHLIDTASGRIDVLMYLWDSDDLDRAVAEHLACWARKGRPVRVLVDGGGNLLHGDPRNTTCSQVNRVVNWLARQPNVQVLRTRNPLARFDHRKLVLVDGRIAWTGGRNFCRAAFEEEHDLTVTVEGRSSTGCAPPSRSFGASKEANHCPVPAGATRRPRLILMSTPRRAWSAPPPASATCSKPFALPLTMPAITFTWKIPTWRMAGSSVTWPPPAAAASTSA